MSVWSGQHTQACNIPYMYMRDDFDYTDYCNWLSDPSPPSPPLVCEKGLCMRSTRGRSEALTDNKEWCIYTMRTVCSYGSAQSTESLLKAESVDCESARSLHMNGRWMAVRSLSRSSQAFEACGARKGTESYANCLQQAAWRSPHDGIRRTKRELVKRLVAIAAACRRWRDARRRGARRTQKWLITRRAAYPRNARLSTPARAVRRGRRPGQPAGAGAPRPDPSPKIFGLPPAVRTSHWIPSGG